MCASWSTYFNKKSGQVFAGAKTILSFKWAGFGCLVGQLFTLQSGLGHWRFCCSDWAVLSNQSHSSILSNPSHSTPGNPPRLNLTVSWYGQHRPVAFLGLGPLHGTAAHISLRSSECLSYLSLELQKWSQEKVWFWLAFIDWSRPRIWINSKLLWN